MYVDNVLCWAAVLLVTKTVKNFMIETVFLFNDALNEKTKIIKHHRANNKTILCCMIQIRTNLLKNICQFQLTHINNAQPFVNKANILPHRCSHV